MAKPPKQIDELKRRLAQIDDLQSQGLLSTDAAKAAHGKLERAIVDAVMAGELPAPPASGKRAAAARPQRSLVFAVLVVATAFVVLAYELQGGRGGDDSGSAGAAAVADAATPPAVDDAAAEAAAAALAEQLKAHPDDAEGWANLGGSYASLGRHRDALPAYKRALDLRPRDAQRLADYADELAVVNNRSLAGEPERLVLQALQIDPANVKALSLAGTAAFDRADYATAIAHWQKAIDASEPGSVMAVQLQGALADARQRAGAPPAPPGPDRR
jgi:cytochrome c-type biogenesis protein CcmH